MINNSILNQKKNSISNESEMNVNTSKEKLMEDPNGNLKLQLREEKLNIYKQWVQTGEVTMNIEVFTEEKTITVPVIHEELVIKKKLLPSETSDNSTESIDTIRIPISEERIDISKHKVTLEDVKIYKHEFQQIKKVEETLKKEKLHVETTGDSNVIDKDSISGS